MKKRTLTILTFAVIGCSIATNAPCADQTKATDVSATVANVFSLAFYTEANKVLYSTSVPFSNVDPTSAFNYADNRAESDGKSDVGLIVRSNGGTTWYFKMHVNAASGLAGKLGAFMGQPTNRNDSAAADGTRARTDWSNLLTSAETWYTAGAKDKTNTPLGTLITMSYKVNGGGLTPGSYTASITYTLTTTA